MLTPYLLDDAGKPRPEWVKLVERFPERFMLGSDVVGRFNKLGKEMRRFDPFLDALARRRCPQGCDGITSWRSCPNHLAMGRALISRFRLTQIRLERR